MKTKKMKRIAIGVISLALAIGIASSVVFAQSDDEKNDTTNSTAEAPVNDRVENATVKNETVYLFTDGSGAVSKTIVSDWLSNSNGAYGLKDVSGLSDIENVKGDQEFVDGVWNANGNDIYYQGTTDVPVPVGIKVTYYLDGEETSAEDIIGKSGKITVKYEYQNNAKVTVPVGEETTDVYVPFLMVTGMVLDNNNFKNVEVTGGKLINDGDRSVIIGYGIPHANEMLGQSSFLNIEIPEEFEFTADVTDFQLDTTYTIATNEIFKKASSIADTTDEKDKIEGLVGQLSQALDDLIDGSTQLNAGITGAVQGATEISSGLQKLSENNDALNGGAKQVFDTLLATADEQLKASGLTLPALTAENYSKILDGVITQAGGDSTEAGMKIIALKNQLDNYNQFYTSLNQYTAGVETAYQATVQLKDGLTQLSGGSKQLSEGISQLKAELMTSLSSISPLFNSTSMLSEIASQYNNFSGITEGTEGNVKFVFKTTLSE